MERLRDLQIAGEAAAERVVNAFGISVASIRPSWIQYPGSYVVSSLRGEFSLETAGRNGNLWSYVDIRDVVGIVEAALTADFGGHETFNAFAADNFLGIPTVEAIEAGYGGLSDDCDIRGKESASRRRRRPTSWDGSPNTRGGPPRARTRRDRRSAESARADR